MITGVRGRLAAMRLDSVIVEVGGISLRVYVPTTVLADLGAGELGREVSLHTHFYMREDQMSLYGFGAGDQLDLFEALIGVSGVGPKAALAMLGFASVEAVRLAIEQGDVDFLKRAPGIGAKTASRIVLELRGKLADFSSVAPPAATGKATGQTTENVQKLRERQQLGEALAGLGYTPPEIERAVAALPTDRVLTLEEQVMATLQFLGQ